MKKSVWILSFVMIAALLLAACGGATNNTAATPGVDLTGEAGGLPTLEATEGLDESLATPTAGVTETVIEETEVVETPQATLEVEATPTTDGAGATDGTQGEGASVIPAEGQYVRLTDLLTNPVVASDSSQVGMVDAVLMQHPEPPAEEAEGEEASGDAAAQATPTVEPTVMTAEEAGQDVQFVVRHLLVDLNASGAASAGETTTDNTGTDSSAAQNAGSIIVIPWQALDFSGGSLALTTDAAAIAQAPRSTLTEIAGGPGVIAGEVSEFWTAQGVSDIPVTGEDATANISVVPGNFASIHVTGMEGEEYGSVNDMIIDRETGEVVHLIISGGEQFENRMFAVPMSHLTWEPGEGTQLGSFSFNFPSDDLQNAPSFEDANAIVLDEGFDADMQRFWTDQNAQ